MVNLKDSIKNIISNTVGLTQSPYSSFESPDFIISSDTIDKASEKIITDLAAFMLVSKSIYVHTVKSNMNGHIQSVITDSFEFPAKEFGLNKNAVENGFVTWSSNMIK